MRLGAWTCILQEDSLASKAYGGHRDQRAPSPPLRVQPRIRSAAHRRRPADHRHHARRHLRRNRRDSRPPLLPRLPVPSRIQVEAARAAPALPRIHRRQLQEPRRKKVPRNKIDHVRAGVNRLTSRDGTEDSSRRFPCPPNFTLNQLVLKRASKVARGRAIDKGIFAGPMVTRFFMDGGISPWLSLNCNPQNLSYSSWRTSAGEKAGEREHELERAAFEAGAAIRNGEYYAGQSRSHRPLEIRARGALPDRKQRSQDPEGARRSPHLLTPPLGRLSTP